MTDHPKPPRPQRPARPRKTPPHLPPKIPDDRSPILLVTVCTQNRRPLLARPEVHDLLRTVWRQADAWRVGRYVVMPDHIHLFCAPSAFAGAPVARWVQFWKSQATSQWPHPELLPIWQKSFWDTQLRHAESYAAKWAYVRLNPVRAGLCDATEQWPFQGEFSVLPWHD
ncbi:MAG: hypothetical protein COX57_00410 [Alphaproteobacteria bacterium CG_4_10_14_0_2_um_filter_63_37]|nr:MAG: hypothetical protein AUJ55_01325 [Proteobacteria bacterium CG1_02_64_396]PJA26010.1 MAG: hypothetical protein COX57_00410 [Alphaproteobacteria bacterium CG_4_10_14_0_2_um_filter_63_37]